MKILEDLIENLPGDAPIRSIQVGAFCTAVWLLL
jgi:hypothetical protein